MTLATVSDLDELMRVIAPKQIWKAIGMFGDVRYLIIGDEHPEIIQDHYGHRTLTYSRWCGNLDESVLLPTIEELERGLPFAAPPLSQQFPMTLISQDYDAFLGRIEGE